MDVKPTEAELNILNEMISFIESHKKWYRQIDVGLCLIKSNDKWRIIQGRIYVEPNLDESQPEQTLNYENIILTRFKIPIEKTRSFFESIIQQRSIVHPEIGIIDCEGRLITYSDKPKIRDHRKASQERVNVCSCKWPYYYFEFNPQTNFYIERKSLVKKGLSLFPSWYHAAHHFLNLGEKPTSIADFRSLIMIVPDPRIAIEKIYLQGKNVKIVVQEGTLDIKDIMVKIYSSLRERYNADIEFKISNKETIYELPYDPDCLSIHIIESEDFDLDHREIDFEWGLTSSGVIIERSEETLLQYLEMGEGQHVEFKESLDDKGLRDKMTKAVSSFANTTGGILFLGVNDEGVPVKSIEKNEADRISQICSELIDSFIKLEFKFLPAQGFEILAILVSEGTEKPYVVKDRGVFVRYNGTTKHADRSQLLSMCPK